MQPKQDSPITPVAAVAFEADDDALYALTSHSQGPPIQTKAFDGHDVISLLIPLVPASIAAIVRIYNLHIAARRYVSVVIDGVEIRGVSEKKLLRIIEATGKQRLKQNG